MWRFCVIADCLLAFDFCSDGRLLSPNRALFGLNKQGVKKFNNIEEIVQELIHTKEKLSLTEEMLDEEIEKSEDYEEILNEIFDNE